MKRKSQESSIPEHGEAPASNVPAPGVIIDQKALLKLIPVCKRTLNTWVAQGRIPSLKVNKRRLFHWPSVESALVRMQRGGEAV